METHHLLDYAHFKAMPTAGALKRAEEEKMQRAEDAIPDLQRYWLQLLEQSDMPLHVDDLVDQIPPALDFLRHDILPPNEAAAVAYVFKESGEVTIRFGSPLQGQYKRPAYCGLTSRIETASPVPR